MYIYKSEVTNGKLRSKYCFVVAVEVPVEVE